MMFSSAYEAYIKLASGLVPYDPVFARSQILRNFASGAKSFANSSAAESVLESPFKLRPLLIHGALGGAAGAAGNVALGEGNEENARHKAVPSTTSTRLQRALEGGVLGGVAGVAGKAYLNHARAQSLRTAVNADAAAARVPQELSEMYRNVSSEEAASQFFRKNPQHARYNQAALHKVIEMYRSHPHPKLIVEESPFSSLPPTTRHASSTEIADHVDKLMRDPVAGITARYNPAHRSFVQHLQNDLTQLLHGEASRLSHAPTSSDPVPSLAGHMRGMAEQHGEKAVGALFHPDKIMHDPYMPNSMREHVTKAYASFKNEKRKSVSGGADSPGAIFDSAMRAEIENRVAERQAQRQILNEKVTQTNQRMSGLF